MSSSQNTEDSRKYGDAGMYSGALQDGILGVFTTMALILLVWSYCWMKNYGAFHSPQLINVVFSQVAGLNVNASVLVDGVRVGIVDRLEWQDKNRVLVKIRINSNRVVVPVGSKFEILTNGIVGAKYVEILLPENYSESLPALDEKTEVVGEVPVRPELAVNKLAVGLSKIDMQKLHDNYINDRHRLVRAADQLALLGKKAMPVVEKALPLEDELLTLTRDVRSALSKINKLTDDPKIGKELKEAGREARETVRTIQSIVHEINTTVKDKNVRKDLTDSIRRLSDASKSVERSVYALERIAGDKELRTDIKDVLKEAKSVLGKADKLLNSGEFSKDIKSTIVKTEKTVEDLDKVARQLNQILDKRFPMMHLMFGRPGHLPKEQKKEVQK